MMQVAENYYHYNIIVLIIDIKADRFGALIPTISILPQQVINKSPNQKPFPFSLKTAETGF